jgi:hypothetical protein
MGLKDFLESEQFLFGEHRNQGARADWKNKKVNGS